MRQSNSINIGLDARQQLGGGFSTLRRGIGLYRKRTGAVATHDQWIFPFGREATDHVIDRNECLSRLTPDHHVIEPVGIQPFRIPGCAVR